MSKSSNPVSQKERSDTRIDLAARILKSPRLRLHLSPKGLARISDLYHDRRIHDGVPDNDRPGFAIRSSDLAKISHGLLSARFATLADADMPQTEAALQKFNRDLIVKPAADECSAEVLRLIEAGLVAAASDEGGALDAHGRALWALRHSHPDMFTAAVHGQIEHALVVARGIADDDDRHDAIRTCARQAIIWGAFDVHRIAARGRSCKTSLVPPFMRSRLTTNTKNEYTGLLLSVTRWMLRQYEAGDKNEKLRPGTLVRRHGPKGPVLDLIEEPARQLETRSGPTLVSKLASVTPMIRAAMEADVQRYELELAGNTNSQQTLHQSVFCGLTEIAALCVTSLRFAQFEARLQRLLIDPDMESDESYLTNKRTDCDYPRGSIGRAKMIAAAYRSAILRDPNAQKLEKFCLSDAKDSWQDAMQFLELCSGTTPARTLKVRQVMYDLNLSHHARCCGSAR